MWSHEKACTRSRPRAMSSVRVVVVGDDAVHLVGEGLFVRGFDQECRVARDLGDRAGARRDHGDTRSHGFEYREAEAFVDRRIREQGRAFQAARAARRRTPRRPGSRVHGAPPAAARSPRRSRAGRDRRGPRSRERGRDGGSTAHRTRRRDGRSSCGARACRSRRRTARRRAWPRSRAVTAPRRRAAGCRAG